MYHCIGDDAGLMNHLQTTKVFWTPISETDLIQESLVPQHQVEVNSIVAPELPSVTARRN